MTDKEKLDLIILQEKRKFENRKAIKKAHDFVNKLRKLMGLQETDLYFTNEGSIEVVKGNEWFLENKIKG